MVMGGLVKGAIISQRSVGCRKKATFCNIRIGGHTHPYIHTWGDVFPSCGYETQDGFRSEIILVDAWKFL